MLYKYTAIGETPNVKTRAIPSQVLIFANTNGRGDMMLLTDVTTVKWNGANRKHYEGKGYVFTKNGDEFEVLIEHLSKGSHSIVMVKCDYCGEVIFREYKVYLRFREEDKTKKDCCKNCIGTKSNESYYNEHGCNISKGTENWKKAHQTIKERYGVDNITQLESVVRKIQNTMVERYGEDYRKVFNSKSQNTMLLKYGKKSLAPQGENHYNWNGGKTSEQHKYRTNPEYHEWRREVFYRDNYTCQCCSSYGKDNLVSHHLYGFAQYENLRYEITNGITLCKNCHDYFHLLYGKDGNNTKEQFDEFIANINKGVTTIENT